MSSKLPWYSLSISNTLPPVVWFFSSVSHRVRRFFIRLILRFSSSISYWGRRFFIYHALSSFSLVRLYAQQSSRPRGKAIVISLASRLKSYDNKVTWRVLVLTFTFTFPSKTLLYHIDNVTSWSGKDVIATINIYDSKGVFPLTDIYTTQVI